MNSSFKKQIYPFMSVCFLIGTLLFTVFCKMEERRLSYVVLKQNRELKKVKEVLKQKEILLARLTKPQKVETLAKTKLTLKRAAPEQIIQLSSNFEESSTKKMALRDQQKSGVFR